VARRIIHFQGGFAGESGVLLLHGREVARCVDLRTSRDRGFARSMEVDRPQATLEALVRVPERGLEARLALPDAHELHVVVCLAAAALHAEVVAEAPGYDRVDAEA
jgi:hypothetical protein